MLKFRNIGELVVAFRKENKMTQEDLAGRLNINRAAVAKIENSQRAVSLDEAIQLGRIFGISVDTLFSYIDDEVEVENNSFVMAFRSKGIMSEDDLEEIREVEMLVDALHTQAQIYRGE